MRPLASLCAHRLAGGRGLTSSTVLTALTGLLALFALLGSPTASAQLVRLQTSLGDIDIELHADKAPATVANFMGYVQSGFYDGVIFHRVIEGFMAQTGGFTPDLKQKPTRKAIPLESANGLSNVRGTVAMVRTSDPQSATSQFFINVADNLFLDKAQARDGHGYAVFGTVAAGMDTVDRIKAVPTVSRGPFQNLPSMPIAITKASVIRP